MINHKTLSLSLSERDSMDKSLVDNKSLVDKKVQHTHSSNTNANISANIEAKVSVNISLEKKNYMTTTVKQTVRWLYFC